MSLNELAAAVQEMVEGRAGRLPTSVALQAEIEVRTPNGDSFQVIAVGWQNGKVVLGVA